MENKKQILIGKEFDNGPPVITCNIFCFFFSSFGQTTKNSCQFDPKKGKERHSGHIYPHVMNQSVHVTESLHVVVVVVNPRWVVCLCQKACSHLVEEHTIYAATNHQPEKAKHNQFQQQHVFFFFGSDSFTVLILHQLDNWHHPIDLNPEYWNLY